jgi:hypothetical protein
LKTSHSRIETRQGNSKTLWSLFLQGNELEEICHMESAILITILLDYNESNHLSSFSSGSSNTVSGWLTLYQFLVLSGISSLKAQNTPGIA